LVCQKLNHYHTNNVQRARRKTNLPVDTEDNTDVGETKSVGQNFYNDASVHQNFTEDEHNKIFHDPTVGTVNAPGEDSIPVSVDLESAQPITAPPGTSLDNRSPMGNTQTMLAEAEPKSRNIKLQQFMMEQRARTNRTDSHHLHRNSAELESRPSEARMESPSAYETSQSPPQYMGQNERSLAPTTQNVKRPLSEGKSGRKSKRNKNYPDVQTLKPTLVVALKLTREKGVSDRPTTMPPQQSYIPMPSVEADEIYVRHPSVSASHYDVVASGSRIGDERASVQPVVPNQDPANDVSEAVMDATYDLYDTDSDYEPTDRIIPVGDTVRPSSATPRQTHVPQKQWNSQAMAEFRKIWADEADEIVNEILTASFRKHTPGELARNILLPVLRHIQDQLPSATVQNDPLSTSHDVGEQFVAQALNSYQEENAAVQESITTSDTAHQTELAEQSVSSLDAGKSLESPVETVSQESNAEKLMTHGRSNSATATETLGEKHAILEDGIIANEQLSKASPGHTSPTDISEPTALKVAGDADSAGPSCDYSQLVQHINLTILIDRRDGSDPEYLCTIGIRKIRNNSDFFNAIEERSWFRLKPDEEVFRAIITEAGRSATERPRIELGLSKGDSEDRSWDMWLLSLRKIHERERVDIKMNLVAKVLVTRRDDWKN
jgi:hypothetical protein